MTTRDSLVRRPAAPLLLITVVSLAAGCSTKAPPQKPPVPVATTTVRRAAVPITITANGTVSPMQTANVSSQVDGIITKVNFQEGQDVTAGQVLFQIEPRPYQAAYDQSRATLTRDSATAAYDAIEAERYDSLVRKDYVTKEQAGQEEATAAAAAATVRLDAAQVASAKFNFDNTTVRAPISGRTGNLLVRTGNLVHGATATPLVLINQIHPDPRPIRRAGDQPAGHSEIRARWRAARNRVPGRGPAGCSCGAAEWTAHLRGRSEWRCPVRLGGRALRRRIAIW